MSIFDEDGAKPLKERVDIETSQSQLNRALKDARLRIDAVFGPFEWTWLDEEPRRGAGSIERNAGVTETGTAINSRQGMVIASPLTDNDFFDALDIVKEEVAPYGFTYLINQSDAQLFDFFLYNREDGGHISVVMNRENRGFSIAYSTGHRPV
ncbi:MULTISPECIES: LppA family lipoprotein [unclassified Actinobaculum]|uniref:LppA family lipoprotein n=1 Tax=unclassified Actinobaculum TaxID=2609299 RepID=UPI000D527C4A|nr:MULTISPECIES: LppA family lipoprotein [unclassified Actinobaculum]AWE42055.1 hypothetical protein DDD63_03955 [Actinobaculum sp. 313]RTE50604.1 hypothetical protein EKN07_00120 [Actinobaculum sp. 352]